MLFFSFTIIYLRTHLLKNDFDKGKNRNTLIYLNFICMYVSVLFQVELPSSELADAGAPRVRRLPSTTLFLISLVLSHVVAIYNLGAASKKAVLLGGGGRWGVRGPTTTFGQKSTTFYFCFHSMQKPSKRVKTQ